jgi:voltage-gated potassium channel
MNRLRRPPAAVRHALACLALVTAYAAVPVNAGPSSANLVLRWSVTIAMLAALAFAIRWEALRQLREPDAPLGGLVVGIVAGVLLFALIDFAVAVHRPGEFSGLETRIDALYYALATLLTVGFGDVTAQGQLARGLLCAQMVFNTVVLAGSASLLAHRVTARPEEARAEARRVSAPGRVPVRGPSGQVRALCSNRGRSRRGRNCRSRPYAR